MRNLSDADLLREYSTRASEEAFCELVTRHTDLVHSAALRQTGSPHVAREIMQTVFTDLARKAPALAKKIPSHGSLAGWLFRGTRLAVLKRVRDDQRRLAHERVVMELHDSNPTDDADWNELEPALDEAMSELNDADREAILLRYFKNLDFRAVGQALGISDDTAQKRVARALDRLRSRLAARGVAVGLSGLALLVSAHGVQAAPVGLALSLSTAALSAAAAPLTLTLTIMKLTAPKIVAIAVVLLAISTGAILIFISDHLPETAANVPLTTNEMLYREMLDAASVAGEVLDDHPTRVFWKERRDVLLQAGYIEARDIPLPKVFTGQNATRNFFDSFHRRFRGVEIGLRGLNAGAPPIAYVTARKMDLGANGAVEQFIRRYEPTEQ